MTPQEIKLINRYKSIFGEEKYSLLSQIVPILKAAYIPYHEYLSIESLKGEYWIQLPDFECLYLISNYSRIISLPTSNRTRRRFFILKQYVNNDGYCTARLYRQSYSKLWLVHRLMAYAFDKDNFNEHLEINHISGIKTQNINLNLESSTDLHNIKHAIEIGLIDNKGEKSHNAKLTAEHVIAIYNSNARIKDLAKVYKVSASVIYKIKTGTSWKHLNLTNYTKKYGLLDDFVLLIFNDSGTYKQIAAKYGVSKTTVQYIKNGNRYAEITGKLFSRKRNYYRLPEQKIS